MFAFKIISNMSRRAIRAFHPKLELTVLHSNNIRSFYAYVNYCIHPRPASPQLINPNIPNSLNNGPNMVSNKTDYISRSKSVISSINTSVLCKLLMIIYNCYIFLPHG